MTRTPSITAPRGDVEAGFAPVADAFAANFHDGGEDAAALTVYIDGRPVVDLWGGEDRLRGRPMARDALMMVASCSKGITATVLGILIERGVIDPDALVGDYWPEYAVNGKEATTVAMVASHRAGLPFPPLGLGLQGLDHVRGPALVAALAAARPLWTPGTQMAYHSSTYGTLVGEIIRRATGEPIARQLQRLIAEPLGLRMWMGLPAELDDSVVPGRWTADPFAPSSERPEPGSYAELRRQAIAEAPATDPDLDDREARRALYASEWPAAGAITDARSLARMYAATLGAVDGVRLYGDETRARMLTPQTDGVPALVETGTTGPDIRFGLGYQLPSGSMPGMGVGSYGHTGAGGRLGLADTETGVAFGYVCSQMRIIPASGDPRWAAIVDAIRRCL